MLKKRDNRIVKFIRFLARWPLTVHCWGGLGSQLYAWTLANRLKKIYKSRRIIINFHTNGTTRRSWEIPFSLEEIGLRVIDDYNFSVDSIAPRSGADRLIVPFGLKHRFHILFQKMGFIGACDTEEDLASLKPWVVQIRGHYSYLEPTVDEAKDLQELIISRQSSLSKGRFNACHYRLGDLTSLTTKSYISWERLSQTITRIGKENSLVIFSDSSTESLSNLSINLEGLNCTWRTTKILDAIEQCIQAENFIGTNSKISVWIAILRIKALNKRYNFLPKEVELHQIDFQEPETLVYY